MEKVKLLKRDNRVRWTNRDAKQNPPDMDMTSLTVIRETEN